MSMGLQSENGTDARFEGDRNGGSWADAPHADGLTAAAHEAVLAGSWENAIVNADEALARAQGHVHALALRAIALARLGRLEQAFAAADAAIERDPAHSSGYAAKGIAYFYAGDNAAALSELEYAGKFPFRCGLTTYYLVCARGRVSGNNDPAAGKRAAIALCPALAWAAPGFWL